MNEKTVKLIYWTATGLLSVMMVMSASMYIFKHKDIVKAFETLGHPSYIIYPLALAKFLGILTIIVRPSEVLKHFAYAGFFFNFLLAAAAHLSVGDGDAIGAIFALVLLAISFAFEQKLMPVK